MGAEKTDWDQLAKKLVEKSRRSLSGSEADPSASAIGNIRMRNAASIGKAVRVARALPRVIAVVIRSVQDDLSEAEIRNTLVKAGRDATEEMDLYYVIPDRAAKELARRELNPEDPDCSQKHRLILANLKPDVVIMPADQETPDWMWKEAQIIPYQRKS